MKRVLLGLIRVYQRYISRISKTLPVFTDLLAVCLRGD